MSMNQPFQTLILQVLTIDVLKVTLITSIYALSSSAIAFIWGTIPAFFLANNKTKITNIFLLFGFIPLLLPGFIPCITWQKFAIIIINNPFFLLNKTLLDSSFYILFSATITTAFTLYPIFLYPMYYLFRRKRRIFYETALLETNSWYAAFYSVFSRYKTTAALCFLLSFLKSFAEFQIPDLMLLKVLSVRIFTEISAFYNIKSASVFCIVQILILMFFTFIFSRISDDTIDDDGEMICEINLKKNNHCLPTILYFVCFALIIFPIITIIFVMLYQSLSGMTFIKAFSSARSEIFISVFLGMISGLLATSLSIIPAYLLSKWRQMRRVMIYILCLPILLPPSLYGLGIIGVWNHKFFFLDAVYHNPSVLLVGNITLFIPYSIFILWLGFKQVGRDTEEAAQIDGASSTQLLYDIYLPLMTPYFISAFVITAILSFGEVGASSLIIPPGWTPLSVRIFTLLHYGMDNFIAALCLLQIAVVILGIFVVSKIMKIEEDKFVKFSS